VPPFPPRHAVKRRRKDAIHCRPGAFRPVLAAHPTCRHSGSPVVIAAFPVGPSSRPREPDVVLTDQAETTGSNKGLGPEMFRRGLHGMRKTLIVSREARRPDFWDFPQHIAIIDVSSIVPHRLRDRRAAISGQNSCSADRTHIHMDRIHQPLMYLGNTGTLHRPGANVDPGSKPR
jgi:hypothetical protein